MRQMLSISSYLAVKEVWRNRGRFLLVSLVIALTFYLGVIVANSLEALPAFHPCLLVWLPVAICAVVAAVLIPKNL